MRGVISKQAGWKSGFRLQGFLAVTHVGKLKKMAVN
jgi:hypothetical protein